tara:strand:- start:79 stop:504 length:426 start_codon:yes stop_codon:yes gene_type:complete
MTEIDVNDLVENIISAPSKPPHSIQLQFEDITNVKELFDFCMFFFQRISVVKYAKPDGKIDLSSWSETHINIIKKYFNSVGLKINIIVTDINDPQLPIYESKRYNKINITPYTQLKEILFTMYHNTSNGVFVINFDNLLPI